MKTWPLPLLHLNLPVCEKSSGLTTQRATCHIREVKAISHGEVRRNCWRKESHKCSYYGHPVTIAIGVLEMLIIVK